MQWDPRPPSWDTVDLYYHDLDVPELDCAKLAPSLSAGEMARAERFRFEHHRRRFILGRGLVRELLGALKNRIPAEIPLEVGLNGKLCLPGGPAFNVSHSEQHLLIAIGTEGRLGVDLELRRSVPDAFELARGNFSQEEVTAMEQLPESEVSAAFLRVWTRKEALLKAIGTGLSLPLDQVSMAVAAGGCNSLRASGNDLIDVDQWCVRSVTVLEELEAAVAWDRTDFEWRLMAGGPV